MATVWMRHGWEDVVCSRGAGPEDVEQIEAAAMRAAAKDQPIPRDRFGAWEFFFIDQPGEDH